MRDSNIDNYGIKVGGRKISNLRYADDTALLAKDHQEASDIINNLNNTGEEKNLKLNAKKTKVMHIGAGPTTPIAIGQEELEEVTNFKYLGSIKSKDADCTKDINARIAMAKKRMISLSNIWKDKNIKTTLKMKIMKCLVWTTMTHGAEGWTLRKTNVKKIQSAEMWFYRRLLRTSWKERRTDLSILQELNTERELVKLILRKKMTFFGHICRSKKCSLMKEAIQGKVEGKRKRGRPRISYLGNIKEWTGRNSPEIFNMIDRRQDWRSEVQRAVRAANILRSDAGQ